MGVGREKKGMKEMFGTPSSVKKGKHQTFVKSILEKGYRVESEESDEKLAESGDVISESLTTILTPENIDMPKLKFVATETFGRYDYDQEAFEDFAEPRFDVQSYHKSAHIMRDRDPWQMVELDD